MQLQSPSLPLANSTLKTLVTELESECQNVTNLIHQLTLPSLSTSEQAEILAELLAATIHLQVHCGEDFQELISQAMEQLPDDDEEDTGAAGAAAPLDVRMD